MFCPLHVLDMTIGYVVLAYDSEMMNMEYLYQFLMNISNALENTKTHQRQQNIISSLENKYIPVSDGFSSTLQAVSRTKNRLPSAFPTDCGRWQAVSEFHVRRFQ